MYMLEAYVHVLHLLFITGVTLYVIPDNVIYDPRLLANFVKANAITRMLFTPSLFEAVLDAEHIDLAGALASMKYVNLPLLIFVIQKL